MDQNQKCDGHLKSQVIHERPNIYSYLDYRIFLRDSYAFKKSVNPRFSLRIISRVLGKRSSSYFKLIVGGYRNIQIEILPQVASLFKLDPNELSYLVTLVQFTHAIHDDERTAFSNELKRKRPSLVHKTLEAEYLEILTVWYAVPLMEFVRIKGFQLNVDWIQKNFGVKMSKEQIAWTFNRLLKLGLVKRDKTGQWTCAPIMSTAVDVPRTVVRDYHAKAHKSGVEMLNRVSVQKRDFTSITLSADGARAQEIREKLREFYHNLVRDYGEEKEASGVYQLNIQFFPWAELQ